MPKLYTMSQSIQNPYDYSTTRITVGLDREKIKHILHENLYERIHRMYDYRRELNYLDQFEEYLKTFYNEAEVTNEYDYEIYDNAHIPRELVDNINPQIGQDRPTTATEILNTFNRTGELTDRF